MAIKTQFYSFAGGVDLVTPAIIVGAGFARASVNYEPNEKGYQRNDGFERLDGRPKPSAANYWILDFDAGTAAISEGDIVTGQGSGATGEALIDAVVETGSYGGSDATGYNVLFNLTGAFQNDENLQVSAVTKSVSDGTEKTRGADTDELDATYIQDAITTTRADILAVPGTGNMRGAWMFGGNEYAFRDNAGATAVDMYKSSSAGWVLQDLGETLAFTSGGTYVIAEGDTVTGAISSATGVVKRVVLTTDDWGNGLSAGRLILYSVSGVFQSETLDVGGNIDVATIAADAVPNTLATGGRFDFANANFGGNVGTNRMYGCDGKSPAWEWDGAVFVPIVTGMSVDTPTHIFVHKKHLFLSFTGGSVQHSGPGDPYAWAVILGAAEIAIGKEVTGFSGNATKTLTIFARNLIAILYGTSVDDWDLVTLTDEAGAIEWTQQLIGRPIYQDDRGLRSLETTQAFGDFKLGTLTKLVEPIFKQKKKDGITSVASVRVRAKDQYRLFWADGKGITLYLGRGAPEIMEFDLGMTVHTIASGEDENGEEMLLFGSTDGFIYQLDAGTSFDGLAITAFVRLPFNHIGSPTLHKRWHQLTLEVEADIGSVIQILLDFGFGDPDASSPSEETFTLEGAGGYWNLANWNEFQWSAGVQGMALLHIDGEGTNMSVSFLSDKIFEEPHTITGITLHYSNLRLQR